MLSKCISRPRAEAIAANRPIEAVEQLLDLKGFSIKVVEDFCSKVCAENSTETGESEPKTRAEKSPKDVLLRSVKPRVNKVQYKSSVQTIAALSFNLYSVSFAHLNKDLKVLDWCVAICLTLRQ